MDAPNAPNPTNPNAQDQFMDAVQGPSVQNPIQGPAALIQVPSPVQDGQLIPIQLPQQLAPVQPVPVQPAPVQPIPVQPAPPGIVVPAPQIMYQN